MTLDTLPPEPEVMRADPSTRRRFVGVGVLALAPLFLLELFVFGPIREGMEGASLEERVRAVRELLFWLDVLLTFMVIFSVGMGVYLFRVARRVSEAGQYPVPGMALIRDTVVEQGPRAERRARALRRVALILLLGIPAAMLYVSWALHELADGKLPRDERREIQAQNR